VIQAGIGRILRAVGLPAFIAAMSAKRTRRAGRTVISA
jgi:hypothetical protein